MAETYNHFLTEIDSDGIATITVNRPDKLNALNSEVLDELEKLTGELEQNRDVRGVLITGAGEKAFVAGADIKELSGLDRKTGKKVSKKGQRIFDAIESFPKPVIAVVNGYALGGGAELAMACHLRIASENAVFGLPEVSLGLIPGYGGTQRLPRLIGRGKALEYILTGGMIKAGEAASIGLANRVEAPGEAVESAKELLKKMLKNGPLALSKAIKAVNGAGTDTGFDLEADLFGELCETEDSKEGTSAFLEKRKPEFKGA